MYKYTYQIEGNPIKGVNLKNTRSGLKKWSRERGRFMYTSHLQANNHV